MTGVDWPEKEIVETTRTTVPDPAGGAPKIIEQKTKRLQPGYLEVVYHLYSMALKHGPVIVRLRTGNRTDAVTLPSLTPVWRAAEFQEREVFDLFGVGLALGGVGAEQEIARAAVFAQVCQGLVGNIAEGAEQRVGQLQVLELGHLGTLRA